MEVVGQAKFIQACRASGYTFRSTDIGVVHDLMIHDIDLVNTAFAGKMMQSHACGFSVFGEKEDIAQARLQFSCGGIANLTASRCSFEPQRSLQIFGTDGFAAVDLANHKVKSIQYPGWMKERQFDFESATAEQKEFVKEKLFQEVLPVVEATPDRQNAILEEQRDWIQCILNQKPLRNTGENAAEAVRIASQVLEQIAAHRWEGAESKPGPAVDFGANGDFSQLPIQLQEQTVLKRAS